MAKKYFDLDGNPVTLDKLCRIEPAWAANRIRQLTKEKDDLVGLLVKLFHWSDKSYLHAYMHVENCVENLRVDKRTAEVMEKKMAEELVEARSILKRFHAWAKGYAEPCRGMGSGMHQEMWPNLTPAAVKEMLRMTKGYESE